MTLAKIQRWFNSLPEAERDLPVVILSGIAYTPRMILMEVQRGTPVGQRLQMMVEAGTYGTTALEELQLAKVRLREVLLRMPNKPIIATLGTKYRVYTPQELLREIEMQTPIGMQWIQAELQHVRRILGVARRL